MARGFSATRGFGAREERISAALPEVKDDAPKAERSQEAVALANSWRSRAVALEPKLTSTLSDLANKLGGKMEGLQFRLKSTDSIARKIDKEVATGMEPDRATAAANMADIIRHTVSFNGGNYTAGVEKMLGALERDGYKLSVKNFWQDGDPYQGINVKVEKDGVKTELQFHTADSLAAKEASHVDYEKYRDLKTSKEEKVVLFRKMSDSAMNIPKPSELKKLLGIGKLILQTPE